MNKASGRDGSADNWGENMVYLGIDVSKATLHTCLLREDGGHRKTKVVENSAAGVTTLLDWLGHQQAAPDETHVILEATGVYHELATMQLVERGVRVSVINPAQAKHFAKSEGIHTKTDAVDAATLALLGLRRHPAAWTPPAPEVRCLQALLARQAALMQDLQRERNRQEKTLAPHTPAPVLTSLAASIAFLEKALAQLDQDIKDHLKQHPQLQADLELLTSIPSIGPKVGQQMLALLSAHRFESAEQAAAYLGLVPIAHQSGTSVCGRPHLSKIGPPRVRAVLYMAAVVAIRYNPHVKALYERLLSRGKTKMAALGAAMRKLVHLCFGVLRTRQPYQADYASAA